jgi:hypothetical protein
LNAADKQAALGIVLETNNLCVPLVNVGFAGNNRRSGEGFSDLVGYVMVVNH